MKAACLLLLFSLQAYAQEVTTRRELSEILSIAKEDVVAMVAGDNKRLQAVKETGFAYSAQNAFLAQLDVLTNRLKKYETDLDIVFDFRFVMGLASDQIVDNAAMELFFLPPVIIEAQAATNVNKSGTGIRTADTTYKIQKHVRLVTAPPTWRSFLLWTVYHEPSPPAPALLPKNAEESAAWKIAVKEGWEAGNLQANNEMSVRIRRLAHEYSGMIRYMRLVEQRVVVPPHIAVSRMPTVHRVEGGQATLSINEQLYQVTAQDRFELNTDKWRASISDDRGAFEDPKTLDEIKTGLELTRWSSGDE